MIIYKKLSPSLNYAFLIAALLFTWVVFAPTQAGGLASYVIIIGKSMEPQFHLGDLVIVHKEAQYQKGDAVAYKNQELNSFVFHRIVDQSLGQFALKGDNNSWIDTYRPTSREVIGKLWVQIPRGGIFMQQVRDPSVMAMIAGALGLVLMSSLFINKKVEGPMNKKNFWERIFPKQNNQAGGPSQKPDSGQSNWWGIFENSFFVLGLIAFISVIFALISFSRPATITVDNDIPYGHLGFYSYAASAPQNIYDANKIQTGDPIFPKLTCVININFQYTMVSAQAEGIAGTYQLIAKVIQPDTGWVRKIPLHAETAFEGTKFETNAELNLCEIGTLIQTLEENTEFHPAVYLLEVSPQVNISGAIAGQKFQDGFDPKLTFLYDGLLYHMVENEESNSLNPSFTGNLREKRSQEAIVSFLGMGFRVSSLRTISVFGLGISLLGMVSMGFIIWNMDRRNPASLIRLKYDALIVDTQYIEPAANTQVIEITTIDSLAKLAERFNSMILHSVNGNIHAYFLQKDGMIYQFILNDKSLNSQEKP